MIIVHTGVISGIVNVCVPITVADGTGLSNSFFKKIIPYVVGEKNEKQQINVSNWSLNDVVPQSPYFYYINDMLPFENCTAGKANFIVFDTPNTATIDSADLKTLQSIISPLTFSAKQLKTGALSQSGQPMLMYNEHGSGGPSKTDSKGGYYILEDCQAIDGMSDGKGSKGPDDDSYSKRNTGMPSWLIGFIFAMILLVIIYFSMNYIINADEYSCTILVSFK